MKKLIFTICMIVCGSFVCSAQSLPLQMKDGAGMLRLGIGYGDDSRWIDKEDTKEVKLTIRQLKDSDGFIVKLEKRKKGNPQLFWAFGGCSDKAGNYTQDAFTPADCKDNVFSVEGNAFTTYYGESMKLRTTIGVTPIGSEVRLSDGNKQDSPMILFESGKKTDAPVICARYAWESDAPLYICIYKQNAQADYNYYMLENVFNSSK
jgi:hypothetical protein